MTQVLVVEDDAAIASILEQGLALRGLSATVVEDGLDGRRAWTAGDYDLVILDVMLPGMNGIDLCAERRAAGDDTPVILLTARDDDGLRTRGEQAGASAYITKPFVYAELIATIRRLLDESRAGRGPVATPDPDRGAINGGRTPGAVR